MPRLPPPPRYVLVLQVVARDPEGRETGIVCDWDDLVPALGSAADAVTVGQQLRDFMRRVNVSEWLLRAAMRDGGAK